MTASSHFKKAVKALDLYGIPILPTYDNKRLYKTTMGGLMTLGTKFGLLGYFIVLFMQVINRTSPQITNTTYAFDYMSEKRGINVTSENFDMGILVDY